MKNPPLQFGSIKISLQLFLVLVVITSLGRGVWKNFGGVRRLVALREETANLEARRQGLEGELQRRQSLAFVENEVRSKLGMVKEGEHVVVLPEQGLIAGEASEREGGEVLAISQVSIWRRWLRVFGF